MKIFEQNYHQDVELQNWAFQKNDPSFSCLWLFGFLPSYKLPQASMRLYEGSWEIFRFTDEDMNGTLIFIDTKVLLNTFFQVLNRKILNHCI